LIHEFREKATQAVEKICGDKTSHEFKHDITSFIHNEFYHLDIDINNVLNSERHKLEHRVENDIKKEEKRLNLPIEEMAK
jgi:hypothetical protein